MDARGVRRAIVGFKERYGLRAGSTTERRQQHGLTPLSAAASPSGAPGYASCGAAVEGERAAERDGRELVLQDAERAPPHVERRAVRGGGLASVGGAQQHALAVDGRRAVLAVEVVGVVLVRVAARVEVLLRVAEAVAAREEAHAARVEGLLHERATRAAPPRGARGARRAAEGILQAGVEAVREGARGVVLREGRPAHHGERRLHLEQLAAYGLRLAA
eukprot:CAMPEP_0205894250 /NCGR_PEP_ID=MMETSP1083-20121108/23741_1 /ASSEMBLY_ACC=CAM_ASM_000430 /TAXON_ID=97485 /ORGANISM="Prymnesium parvum, Strain Texoma1" /LENGTH=218 /DNA_ID=CAMNT_0053259085 /DNA_START=170 /DNA_END=826 /DNA_ORIENTATION=+